MTSKIIREQLRGVLPLNRKALLEFYYNLSGGELEALTVYKDEEGEQTVDKEETLRSIKHYMRAIEEYEHEVEFDRCEGIGMV